MSEVIKDKATHSMQKSSYTMPLIAPKLTNKEMNDMPSMLKGQLIYNTCLKLYYAYDVLNDKKWYTGKNWTLESFLR